VKEQVESLGARFVELPLQVEDAEDASGYAKAQSEAFYAKQREVLAERVCAADVVITTAQVPGAPAPRLIEAETVAGMRPGSVIVDLAAERGGNCALTQPGREIQIGGVTICGPLQLASRHAAHASQLYGRNMLTFLLHLLKDGQLHVDLEDEVTRGTLLTHGGEIVQESVRKRLAG
jgi:NAD(P) transhydrogenase subunit alpha